MLNRRDASLGRLRRTATPQPSFISIDSGTTVHCSTKRKNIELHGSQRRMCQRDPGFTMAREDSRSLELSTHSSDLDLAEEGLQG